MNVKKLSHIHYQQPAIVLGTGPSVWKRENPEATDAAYVQLRKKVKVVIGINRAYNLPIRLDYQISLDKIWVALLKTRPAKVNHAWLLEYYRRWRLEHPELTDWTMEHWLQAYQDKLTIHPEVLNYYKLCSPFAPFMRLVSDTMKQSCPYAATFFAWSKRSPMFGQIQDGLLCRGNTAQAAIHLALGMGCNPILLLGIDMTVADPKKHPWEKGAIYHLPSLGGAFHELRAASAGKTHVWNCSPKSRLTHWPRITLKEGLAKLK